MRTVLLPLALLAAAALPALAGPYDQPYALVESGYRSDVRKERPVLVNSIDGESTMRRRYSTPVSPGKHQVDVYFTTSTGPSAKHHRLLEIDAAPCVRYRIVAHYDNLTHIEWAPVIYSEPIGECEKKFGPRG